VITGSLLFVGWLLLLVVGAVALYLAIRSETSNPPVMDRDEAESLARDEARRRARRAYDRDERRPGDDSTSDESAGRRRGE
jgi:hypothetical protein